MSSDKTILVTRPKGDEKALTDLLHAHGYRVIHEPLTQIYLHHTKRQELHAAMLSEPDAVLVTSRHAVQAIAYLSDVRDSHLICVGDATARAAQSQGFTRVEVVGGTVDAMIDWISASYDEDAHFLYISGEHVRRDIGGALASRNMNVQRIIAYEAIASEELSDTLVELLKRGQVDATTFLSQRAATIFTQLLAQAHIADTVTHLDAFCLSAAISEPLLHKPWKHVYITGEATLASLIECVDNAYQTRD